MSDAPDGYNWWWRIGPPIVGSACRLLFRLRYRGVEHIPPWGSAILAANHVSMLDGIVLALAPARFRRRPCRFLVASEFFERPLLRFFLKRFRQIRVRRGEQDTEALDEAIHTIRAGVLAGIFPEGRINEGTELQRGRSGTARIALATGAAVIPAGIWGTQDRYPKSGLRRQRPWRTRITVSFGEPILPAGDADSPEDIQHFTDRVMAAIADQTARARADAEGPRR